MIHESAETHALAPFARHMILIPYIELDGAKGSDVYEVIRRQAQIKRAQREDEEYKRLERSENAMQCGMTFGVQGYNDAMGYDSEPYDPSIHDMD